MDVVKVRPGAILPEYQTVDAAGADLHACIDEPITLQPMERRMIPTGIAVAIPKGYELQIRARSGLSFKYGVTIINGIGTIDADYRDEMGVILINFGQDPFIIEPGMRIAQMVVARYEHITWNPVESLDATDRLGGFGSSGH